jgi:hypothetical protein
LKEVIMKSLIAKISIITGLALLPSLAQTLPNLKWSSPFPVKTIFTDNCSGSPMTAVYLTGDTNPNPYYFPVNSPASAHWLSELETALSTGQSVQIKYDQNSSNTSQCGFNPGNQVYIISINP